MGEKSNEYTVLVDKSEEKWPFGRFGHRWKNDIKTDLTSTGWDCMDWIHMALDRHNWQALVNTIKNLWVQDASLLGCCTKSTLQKSVVVPSSESRSPRRP